MDRKRKSDKYEEKIKKKIAKLQDKLAKTKPKRRRIISSSSSDSEIQDDIDTSSTLHGSAGPSTITSPRPASPILPSSKIVQPSAENSTALIGEQELPSTDTVEPLDEDILTLLGDAPKEESALGKPVHKDIASRWNDILSKGLPKETKNSLLNCHLIPSNCELLVPPSLNQEVKVALPEGLVKRDAAFLQRQKELGIAISALATATELIISDVTSKQSILKPISDACRILCDIHYSETRTRRNFVINAINAEMKETLMETARDKFLFGDNLSEKLKAAKNIQRSGDTLKTSNKSVFNKNNFRLRNKNNLNSKPQHRKTVDKAANSASKTPSTSQRTHRGSSRKTSDRSHSSRNYRRK